MAQKRGSRTMSPEDIIFIIRHDKTKLNRILDHLSWKDVRKNVKQASGDKGDDGEAVEDGGHLFTLPFSPAFITLFSFFSFPLEKLKAPKRKKVKLSFDHLQSLSDQVKDDEFNDDIPVDSIHLQEIEQRLREADEVTKSMTRQEYIEFAECRQASFTYKKPKKFRDWVNLGAHIDMRPNDEILEILGFIAWEMVSRLTKTALLVKKDFELVENQKTGEERGDKEKKKSGLFGGAEDRTPIKPEHIREAYRRMQLVQRPFDNFRGGMTRSSVNIW